MKMLGPEELPELLKPTESEYHYNDPAKGTYIDKKSWKAEIKSIEEVEEEMT